MNTSYLKEMYSGAQGKNSLALLNPKQLRDASKDIARQLSNSAGMKGMVISFSYDAEQFLSEPEVQEIKKSQLIFVDLSSGKNGSEKVDGFDVHYVENPANLTSLEIHLERFLKSEEGPKFVLFESVNALSVYVDEKTLQKFIYYLNNKVSLEEGTLIILTVKDSTRNETLDLIKQFSDRTFDFSEIFTSEVENLV